MRARAKDLLLVRVTASTLYPLRFERVYIELCLLFLLSLSLLSPLVSVSSDRFFPPRAGVSGNRAACAPSLCNGRTASTHARTHGHDAVSIDPPAGADDPTRCSAAGQVAARAGPDAHIAHSVRSLERRADASSSSPSSSTFLSDVFQMETPRCSSTCEVSLGGFDVSRNRSSPVPVSNGPRKN